MNAELGAIWSLGFKRRLTIEVETRLETFELEIFLGERSNFWILGSESKSLSFLSTDLTRGSSLSLGSGGEEIRFNCGGAFSIFRGEDLNAVYVSVKFCLMVTALRFPPC